MESIAKIRRMYHVDGKGFKTIARELNMSKNTIKKIIHTDATALEYERKQQGHRVLEDYIEKLTAKLKYDVNEPKRRKRTAQKIYLELQIEGYAGSYDAVHAFVKQWRLKHKQSVPTAFVPLEFSEGDAFQFDWSTEEIELAGQLTRIKVAHIRLCYSRYFLMIAYPNEQLEMVMDAHNKAFEFFSGVCKKGIYDNMKTAVTTVLLGKDREYNVRFLQLCSHHIFEPIACTPASGWEKGQVENQVDTGRCNFFTPLVKVENLDELNEQLEKNCLAWAKNHKHPEQKMKTVYEMYEEERPYLTAFRGHFDSYKVENEVVSPYCFVRHATNCYSAECQYVGHSVQVRIYAKTIIILHKSEVIGRHMRSFERYKRIYDPWHYVPLLERKPGAIRNGAPFKSMQLPTALQKTRDHLACFSDGDKRFIRILLCVPKYGLATVEKACALAFLQGGCNDTVILSHLQPKLEAPQPTVIRPALRHPPTADCTPYNIIYLSQDTFRQGARHVS